MRAALFVSLLLLASVPASAQHASPVARELRVAQQSSARSGAASFGIEALGGAIGSGIGFGAVYLLANDCESEDLSCTLETAFLALLTATGGAAAGTLLAGDAFDTEVENAWVDTTSVTAGKKQRSIVECLRKATSRWNFARLPEGFVAVGAYYAHFTQTTDDRVIQLLHAGARS